MIEWIEVGKHHFKAVDITGVYVVSRSNMSHQRFYYVGLDVGGVTHKIEFHRDHEATKEVERIMKILKENVNEQD